MNIVFRVTKNKKLHGFCQSVHELTNFTNMTIKYFRLFILILPFFIFSCQPAETEPEENPENPTGGNPGSNPGVNPSGAAKPEQYYFWKSTKTPQTGDHVLFASANGKPSNSGTKESPLDLTTALDRFHTPNSSPKAGNHYLYLLQGIYTGGYVVKFNRDAGVSNASLTIMPYPGEIALFDATNNASGSHSLYVNGSNIIVEGLVLTSRNTNRLEGRDKVVVCGGIFDDGYNNRFINNIIHDVNNCGIATEPNTRNSSPSATVSKTGGTLVYGNILFNCGYPVVGVQGHGNMLYLQNNAGTKRVENNIFFNSFRDQITVYHSGKDIKNVEIAGNISFNAGAPGFVTERNILAGCEGNLTNISITNNSLFHSNFNNDKSNLQVGYGSNGNTGLLVEGNVIFGGGNTNGTWGSALEMNRQWANSHFKNNLIVNRSIDARLVWYPNIPEVADRKFTFTGNRYHMGRTNSNQSSGETYDANKYPANEVKIYPIKGENRAYVAVFNFEKKHSITVNINDCQGSYQVYDAQNLVGGTAVASGSGNNVTLPLNLTKTFKPVGKPDGKNFKDVPHTEIEFNAFVVVW